MTLSKAAQAERARIREEKKKQRRIEHKKEYRRKWSKRRRARIRAEELKRRRKLGDERGYYKIVLVKNNKQIKRFGFKLWKTNAYNVFNKAIEENKAEVRYPLKYHDTDMNKTLPVKYELLIIKKIEEGENNVAQFRDETGKYVDNVIENNDGYIIIAKHEWMVEETFKVYGYHPIRDRKTFGFIMDEMLLGSVQSKYDITSVFTFKNKVIFSYIDDFDFITCRNAEEAQRLFSTMQKQLPKEYKKNILFIGEVSKARVSTIIDSMQEKTGQLRSLMRKMIS